MSKPDAAWWEQAKQARDQLAARILDHPAVSLIDIGTDPEARSAMPVLRVHLRQPHPADLAIPAEVNGIDVRVLRGDYTLQRGSASSGEETS